MIDYIITFYTHYDAISCSRKLKKCSIETKLSPVPRSLSSSCGTCLQLKGNIESEKSFLSLIGNEFEQLFRLSGDSYTLLQNNRA